MRVLAITAGAGPMYCGSCLRDNALAAEMMARGHDVDLLPIYTPTTTDSRNVSDGHVFFGGISVYLQQHVPLFRRTPRVLDRLWDAPAVIKAFAGGGVAVDPKFLGELTVSTLKGEEGFQRKEVLKLCDHLRHEKPFDLIVLPNSMLLGLAGPIRRATGRPVACTLQGEDLFLDGLGEPYREQALGLIRRHAAEVDAFVSVSHYYADFMATFAGLPRERIHVVPLGVALDGHAPPEGERAPGPPRIGYFARVAPEKGLLLLAEAYVALRRERGLGPARLLAAGYLAPEHRSYLEQVKATLASAGLLDEFEYRGTVSREDKLRFFHEVDLLAVPSPYAEPKGLYLFEAQASGLPVISPAHGAFPEVLGKTRGGRLFRPGDTGDLAAAIAEVTADLPAWRDRGRAAASAVREHYSVARMAADAAALYEKVVAAFARGERLGAA